MSARREKRLRRLEARVEALEKIAATPAYTIRTGGQETEADYWRKRAYRAEFVAMDATKPRKSLFKRLLDKITKGRCKT